MINIFVNCSRDKDVIMYIIDVNTPIYKSVNHLLCMHVICLAL